ncbi:succinate dehydrogenase subunit 7, mitochondrial-like isoform X1 [Panicum virgatum]|uniref:Uncharacterized protein n=1 Tax=Panicum virgatum TaxID=38727 RepID=A0A8T0W6M0_PANVG|nr:succinate dehydrogenase subunit 7, mitochondrial-like isoform X1 [Panicum virgatum]KAG2643240.1 hypothetical protein PVAP13_2KG310800 [Panicum virgatum]
MAQPAFLSSLRSHRLQPSRGYHVELGAREKALLEEDVALKRFKSYKNSVKQPAAMRSLCWQQAQNEGHHSRLAAQISEEVIHRHTSCV